MKNKLLFLKYFITLCGIFVISLTVSLFFYIFIKGLPVLSLEFIFSSPKGIPIGTEGGIFPAIIGTLYLGLLSGAMASFFSLFTACYFVFFGKNKGFKKLLKAGIHFLSGFPSILFGLISYTVFIAHFGFKKSLFVASVTVALMIIPFITIRFEKILIENSKIMPVIISLGISKSYALFKMILPSCSHSLISAVLLGSAYGMGAAAPIMYTGAVLWAKIPKTPLEPFMSLPYHLYILLADGISDSHAYGTAAILLLLLLILDIIGKSISARRRKN